MKENLRQKILSNSYKAGACHIGSAMSCVEILEAMNEVSDWDEFVFSKASGVSAYYAIIGEDWKTLKEQPLPGKRLRWQGGSLGQGLSVACGMALAGKTVAVLMSDGEFQEGQTWEALMFASHHNLKLKVVIDRNGFQALGKTEDICKLEPLKEKLRAFGWDVVVCNGHNVKRMVEELSKKRKKPFIMIANTVKGRGVSFMENDNNWHYKNLNEEGYKKAMVELGA